MNDRGKAYVRTPAIIRANLRAALLYTFVVPWRFSQSNDLKMYRPTLWRLAWAWALTGLLLGAVGAPSFVQLVGLANTGYQYALLIGITVLAGILAQFVGWFLGYLVLAMYSPPGIPVAEKGLGRLVALTIIVVVPTVTYAFPVVGVGYGLYRYFSWVGAGQQSVIIASVGGLLIKTFGIPLIKGIVTGALFKWFMGWLRGGSKAKSV